MKPSSRAVIWAMSVVPIAWISCGQIAAELGRDSSEIMPILKQLLAKGKIIRRETGTLQWVEWRLSDEMAEKAINLFEALDENDAD